MAEPAQAEQSITRALTASVDVVSAYPFHMFNQAAQLARLGALRRLHTAYPARLAAGVPRDQVRSRPYWAAVRRAASKAGGALDAPLNRRVIADFDRWAASHVDGAIAVIGLSSFATATLATAKRLGAMTACDRGSTHILSQQEILRRESQRWNLPMPSFDPWIIDRELQEYETADCILVPSEPAFASFVDRGIDRGKLRKVPYGVDLSGFSPLPRGSTPARGTRFVSVGPVGIQKGHQYLLPAYRRVRGADTSLHLVGPAERTVTDVIVRGDEDVSVVGAVPRSQVADHLRSSSVFVLASVQEGLSLSVLQAMACAIPVIVSEATGAAEYVTDGAEGFVVPTGDTDALAEAMQRFVDDPDLVTSMGAAARRRVEAVDGWNGYGQRLLRALATVEGPTK
ncbi:MAG: glycosyltransferase family 4 protein [Acidimicrobiia bacterium]